MKKPGYVRPEEGDRDHITLLLWRATLAQIAARIGVTESTLSAAHKGKSGIPQEALTLLRTLKREDFPKGQRMNMRQAGSKGAMLGAFSSRRGTSIQPYYREKGDR